MNAVESVYRCPNCNEIVEQLAANCRCGATFEGTYAWKPRPENSVGRTSLPGISFVLAESFFFGVLLALVSFGWELLSQTNGSSRTLGSIALWHLMRFGGGSWLVILVATALLRWTVLAKVLVPEATSGKALIRWSAILLVLQLSALLVLGPILSMALAPVTLGSAFLLTLVANCRIAFGVLGR